MEDGRDLRMQSENGLSLAVDGLGEHNAVFQVGIHNYDSRTESCDLTGLFPYLPQDLLSVWIESRALPAVS